MSALIVDRNMLEGFVGAVFRYVDEGTYFQLRAFYDRANGSGESGAWGAWPVIQMSGSGLATLVDAAVQFAQKCADADAAIVFCPPVVTLGSATEAAEKNIANGVVLSVECDRTPAAAREFLEDLLGPATVVVASGGEWACPLTGAVEAKLHLHWRLQEPTREFRDHQRLKEARRLAQQLAGADGSAVPLVHPMRWPGSWHRKGEPRLAGIVALNEDAEIDLGEALAQLRQAVAARGDDTAEADYTNHQSTEPGADPLDVAAALAAIPNADLSWDEWNRTGMAIWRATGGSDAGLAIFAAWSAKSRKNVPPETRARWDHYRTSPPTHIGAGTLFFLAQQARPGWRKPSDIANDWTGPPRSGDHGNGPQPGGDARRDEAEDRESYATSTELWPEPANLLDPAPVPQFPVDFLPGSLGDFARQQAFDLQSPLDFVAIPLLVIAATAIGNDFRMAPKAHASWTERACLWGGCIGYVGDGKTPAFNAALAPIWPLQKAWREQFQAEQETYKGAAKRARATNKQWERATAAALKKGEDIPPIPDAAEMPEVPCCREMMTNDTTQERVAMLLRDNPRGALLYRDELSGWFSTFNQYRPGADEQFYLQCHAGGTWLQHRVKGDVVIPDIYLSILGGFQPDVITAALSRGSYSGSGKPDNGLTARFSLLVWPEPVSLQWVDSAPDRNLRDRINRLFARLTSLDPENFVGPRFEAGGHYPPLRFSPEAEDVFRDWYLAHHQAQQALDPEAQIKGHFAKYDGLFARLALVHHLLRYAQDEPGVEPATVDAVTASAVRRFIDGYLRLHARKIYSHLGQDPGYAGAKKIAQWLVDNPAVARFTAREISRKKWAGLTGRDENTGRNYLRAALDHLDNVAAWVRPEDVPTGPKGGRPTVEYVVSPRVKR